MALRRGTMLFFYSKNQKVRQFVNPKTGKINPGGNFKSFNENWEASEAGAEGIAKATAAGDGLCAWHLVNGKRVKDSTGTIKAGLIIIDIDNQADYKDENGNKVQKQELNVKEALELDICKKYLSFAYYSPSTTPEWPRFRLVFGLERPVVDPDFYQWFVREVAEQIPGSDRRATQAVNLFYGGKSPDDLICWSHKYIPVSKINEALQAYNLIPKEIKREDDPAEALEIATTPDGIDVSNLLSSSVRSMLEGAPVEDRSFSMAVALKELIGWSNWLGANDLPIRQRPLDMAHQIFENIYEYDPALDGKFNRILGSISDASTLLPAVAMASEEGETAPWKKIKYVDRALFDSKCPDTIKEQIKAKKPKPSNSILSIENFEIEATPEPTSTFTVTEDPPEMPPTPQTPAQLVQIQNNNRQFSENDIAEIIVSNYGDSFLFDSSLDEFFTYDNDEGIWYLNDEQHIKRRIVSTLDTFIQAGVLPRYNSATVNSVFQLLKAKLLRSVRGGRSSIWQTNRGKVAFENGVLDTKTLEFKPGNHKDMYFQTKLAFQYGEDPACPKFLGWLEWAVGVDKVVIIQAFCRAVLTGYTTGEKFLHLIGAGGSGKSTLQQILIALAGFTGTHTSDLETIETNRFEAHSLIGKRLLLLTDEASFSKRLDTLKKLTSASDTLRAERKYGTQIINFKPELLVSIASNEHISSSDISSGLERRRLTIVMNNVVSPSKRRNLISVFPDRVEGELADELPNIAAWCLSMDFDKMRDTLANPVKYCPDLNTTNIEALIFNNPIVAWLSECTLYAPNSQTPLGGGAFRPTIDEQERGLYVKSANSEIYASYANFAKSNGYKAAAKPRFVDRLKETVNNVLKIQGIEPKFINGKAVIKGLRIKPYDPSTDRAAAGDNRLPSPVEFVANPSLWGAAFQAHDPNPEQESK